MKLPNPRSAASNQGRVRPGPGSERCLDALQLDRIEKALRARTDSSRRPDLAHTRRRVFLIFLLIRRILTFLGFVINGIVFFLFHHFLYKL